MLAMPDGWESGVTRSGVAETGSVGSSLFILGAPNHVYASGGVPCSQARRLMRKLLAGSSACYPSGFTDTPRCVLEGFHCSAHSHGPHLTRGVCVHRNRRIDGDIEA